MFRMLARRRGQVLIEAGVDKVIWGLSLPSDSVVHDIRGDISIFSNSDVNRNLGTFYGMEMWVLPVFDPDSSATYQNTFDRLVPKDTDVQAIDLDTTTPDVTPFFEPGETDWSQVLDVGLRPKKLYGRYKMLDISNAIFVGRDPESPFALEYVPGERVHVRVKAKVRVSQPSVLMLAVASPALDDTVDDTDTIAQLIENEWPRVKYARQMLKQAMMDLIGLTEAGAEVPWENATDLLQKHLEPDVREDTASNWASVQFQTFSDFKIDHSVVGDVSIKMLSTGR